MGFKDLFIVSDEDSNEKPKETAKPSAQTTKFPTAATSEAPVASTTSFPQPVATPSFNPTPVTPSFGMGAPIVSNEHLEKAVQIYQAGFDNLNQPGFDFYEFFQSVATGGIDNPAVYAMAFQMASAMDKTISKDKLTSQADFYLTEMQKLYEDYSAKGKGKKEEVQGLKANENQSLTHEVETLKNQLESLSVQLEDRKNRLLAIDSKYNPQLSEIDSKLAANDMAKDRIMNSIQQVKQGIINNVKQ